MMWLLVTLSAMTVCAAYELLGKQIIDSDRNSPLKLRISVIAVECFLLAAMWVLRLGESGASPLALVVKYPLIAVITTCNVFDTFLYLFALRYIGLGVQESFYGTSGILLFIGMITVNLLTGNLREVRQMLLPGKLLVSVILVAAAFVLPNIKDRAGEETVRCTEKAGKHNMVLGLLFTLAGLLADTGESILTAVAFSDVNIGSIDFMMAGYVVAVFWGILLHLVLYLKTGETLCLFCRKNVKLLVYGLTHALCFLLTTYGIALTPVQANILWTAYPVIPILGAAIILKERYSLKQYLCIGVILASSVAFCLMVALM